MDMHEEFETDTNLKI